MKRVTKKMIAERLAERFAPRDWIEDIDIEDAYNILRDEAGNPTGYYSDDPRGHHTPEWRDSIRHLAVEVYAERRSQG